MAIHDHGSHPDPSQSAAEFWEERYRAKGKVWSGNPNPVLVATVESSPAAQALDLGCGEGADSVWLAGLGWQVTAVDVSATALRRTAEHAGEAGVGDRVTCQRHDLARTFPEGRFDLISAQFLQSPLEFPRVEVLRRAAGALKPRGLLFIVDHAAAPPWSEHSGEDRHFPTATETVSELDLDENRWHVERCDTSEREAIGPNGDSGVLIDNIIAIRRAD